LKRIIEAKALEVLLKCGIPLSDTFETSPISLRSIFAHYPQLKLDFLEMSPATDGVYIRNEMGQAIYINRRMPYVRRRYTQAHELGHHELGHPSNTSSVGTSNHWMEVQANHFAAYLLMPRELMKLLNRRFRSLAEIALWFRVSELAMAIRMEDLKLRSFESRAVRARYELRQASQPLKHKSGTPILDQIVRDLSAMDPLTRKRLTKELINILQGKKDAL